MHAVPVDDPALPASRAEQPKWDGYRAMPAAVFSLQREVPRRGHQPIRTQQRIGQLEQPVAAHGQAGEDVLPAA
ncbi:hypothetical protein AB0G67_27005 [Streptomyces sp. NPDC021056]|uniref:hypothetical protein n=1 Tax=Streptomyces sp. NPDC021056 TaxID=3155012 RepID=UPI0033EC1E78